MKVGELIVDTGKIPDTVLFAFTTVRDNHFNAHEWLVSSSTTRFDRLLGLHRLMWVTGGFALLQFGLCVVLARRRAAGLGAALMHGDAGHDVRQPALRAAARAVRAAVPRLATARARSLSRRPTLDDAAVAAAGGDPVGQLPRLVHRRAGGHRPVRARRGAVGATFAAAGSSRRPAARRPARRAAVRRRRDRHDGGLRDQPGRAGRC